MVVLTADVFQLFIKKNYAVDYVGPAIQSAPAARGQSCVCQVWRLRVVTTPGTGSGSFPRQSPGQSLLPGMPLRMKGFSPLLSQQPVVVVLHSYGVPR